MRSATATLAYFLVLLQFFPLSHVLLPSLLVEESYSATFKLKSSPKLILSLNFELVQITENLAFVHFEYKDVYLSPLPLPPSPLSLWLHTCNTVFKMYDLEG